MQVNGRLRVPGDKSISHRALIFAALATGESRITGLLTSADVQSTADILRALGVSIPSLVSGSITVRGRGPTALHGPGACPFAGGGTGFCPAFTPPPYQITRGQVLAVLPFGNVVTTVQINGAELKTMLENGVSSMPGANGRFPQVSGLCFTYDISAPAGSRVTSAVRQAADGSCTGAAINLLAGSNYKIAENDFMTSGGDGYPNFFARATTQNIMDQVLADYVTANSPLNPTIQGRIKCIKVFNPASTNICPAGSP